MMQQDLGIDPVQVVKEKPMEIDLGPPVGPARVYVFNVAPSVGRGEDEFNIMLALPDRAQFSYEGRRVFVVGYCPMYSVYVLWDGELYKEFTYNRSLYVKQQALAAARKTGTHTFSREIRRPYFTQEEVVVSKRDCLRQAFTLRRKLTQVRICSEVSP